jgi:dsDNA-specific endonuclease/ATPase MutS2
MDWEILVPIIAIVMGLGIPLSAIIGSFWLKGKKLDAEGGGLNPEQLKEIRIMLAQQNELQKRVENLEYITSDATITPLIEASNQENKLLQQQIDLLGQELREIRKVTKSEAQRL